MHVFKRETLFNTILLDFLCFWFGNSKNTGLFCTRFQRKRSRFKGRKILGRYDK